MSIVYIYGLIDPRNDVIRYIGKTTDIKKRLKEHCVNRNERTKRSRWILSLWKLGLRPRIFILEEVDENSWQEAEVFWISYLKSIGIKLMNGDNGGLGANRISLETRKKIGESQRGKIISPETRIKIGNAQRGKKLSESQLQILRLANLGKILTPEHRRKLSLRMMGNTYSQGSRNHTQKHTDESKRKMSESQKKRWIELKGDKNRPEINEWKRKISNTLSGRKLSEEHKENIRKSMIGRKFRPETIERMRESALKRWEK